MVLECWATFFHRIRNFVEKHFIFKDLNKSIKSFVYRVPHQSHATHWLDDFPQQIWSLAHFVNRLANIVVGILFHPDAFLYKPLF